MAIATHTHIFFFFIYLQIFSIFQRRRPRVCVLTCHTISDHPRCTQYLSLQEWSTCSCVFIILIFILVHFKQISTCKPTWVSAVNGKWSNVHETSSSIAPLRKYLLYEYSDTRFWFEARTSAYSMTNVFRFALNVIWEKKKNSWWIWRSV